MSESNAALDMIDYFGENSDTPERSHKPEVFVSSTYNDLKNERLNIKHALEMSGYTVTGMEIFVATPEERWASIKNFVDQCDYYILVIAGRFGTFFPGEKISYTEKEYRYALERKKPCVVMLHNDTDPSCFQKDKTDRLDTESEDDYKAKVNSLRAFREFAIKENSGYGHWRNELELTNGLLASMHLLKDKRIKNLAEENARLKKEIETLESNNQTSPRLQNSDSEDLERRETIEDSLQRKMSLRFMVHYNGNREGLFTLPLSMMAIFMLFAGESEKNGEETHLFKKLNDLCDEYARGTLSERLHYVGGAFDVRTEPLDQETVEVIRDFFREAGLFYLSEETTQDGQGKICWTLTEEGKRLKRQIKYEH
jgi:hypothetical protein